MLAIDFEGIRRYDPNPNPSSTSNLTSFPAAAH
jgi:hypothetical protein